MIGCLHWGNWCVYNWPCLHWRFADILGLPSFSLPWWKSWNPKGTAQIKAKSPLPTPHLARQSLEGQSIEFNSRHLLSKANRIWALASCEVTSKAKNGDAVQRTTWMIDILCNTVYKNQAQHLLDIHLLKKRWPFHLWLIKCLLDQIAVLIHTLLWIQKLHWVYSDADAGRNSPLLQPLEVAERFKKQMLSELPVMPCPSNAERSCEPAMCETPAELGCANAVINSPCSHLEGFHSPRKEKTALHALSQSLLS